MLSQVAFISWESSQQLMGARIMSYQLRVWEIYKLEIGLASLRILNPIQQNQSTNLEQNLQRKLLLVPPLAKNPPILLKLQQHMTVIVDLRTQLSRVGCSLRRNLSWIQLGMTIDAWNLLKSFNVYCDLAFGVFDYFVLFYSIHMYSLPINSTHYYSISHLLFN